VPQRRARLRRRKRQFDITEYLGLLGGPLRQFKSEDSMREAWDQTRDMILAERARWPQDSPCSGPGACVTQRGRATCTGSGLT